MSLTGLKSNPASLILCALFAALIAAGAFIRVPVPVVPFTLQFLFTTLAGLLLGSRLGSLAVAVYIAVGLAGFPIFAQGGGLGYIFQPTFGYMIGFYFGTYLTGSLAHTAGRPSAGRMLLAAFAGLAVVYCFGIIYYYLVANYYIRKPIGVWPLLMYGFLLPLPGDAALCVVSAVLGKRLIPILGKR